MNLNLIKDKILEVFQKHKLVLYSIENTNIGHDNGVTVLIDNSLNSDVLEKIHMEVLNELGALLPDDYYLELSTVGLERPIKTLDELKLNVGEYIYLETNKFKGNATLLSVVDDKAEISYFIKGRPSKLTIDYSQMKNVRKAVKF